jgi:hypothetical protein
MPQELAAPQATSEAGGDKAGADEGRADRPGPEWLGAFTDLCAEIAWGSDPASATVRRLARRCTEALKALTGGAGGATSGPAAGA